MLVAKLSTGKVVRILKDSQKVKFSEFEHVLVNDNLDARQARWKPYWVLSTLVVWRMNISDCGGGEVSEQTSIYSTLNACCYRDYCKQVEHERDQLRAELEYDQRNAAMSQSESARLLDENTKLRTELAAALAACKAKDEALNTIVTVFYPKGIWKQAREALAIQPDDSALKAWLGAPVAWEFTDAFGTHYTDDRRDWMDTPGIESVTPLYSPKGLK